MIVLVITELHSTSILQLQIETISFILSNNLYNYIFRVVLSEVFIIREASRSSSSNLVPSSWQSKSINLDSNS